MSFLKIFLFSLSFAMVTPATGREYVAGFFLPDSIAEMSIPFESVDNLIILPVVINDSIKVNLILDTGCRNLVLFGKKFSKLFRIREGRDIIFSGLGNGKKVVGKLSTDNKVAIKSVLGRGLPVVVVPEKNVFSRYKNIHGVIGYDIFLKFEIEINSQKKVITFRPAGSCSPKKGFAFVPMTVADARPVMSSQVTINGKNSSCDLMIDTGSSLGLLLKTNSYNYSADEQAMIGMGFNGKLYGVLTNAEILELNGYAMRDVDASVIESEWSNHASIGMGILKDYIVVINYCQSYACFRQV